jgi:hypothetical protein
VYRHKIKEGCVAHYEQVVNNVVASFVDNLFIVGSTTFFNLMCFLFGKQGHIARQCRSSSQHEDHSNVQCYECGRYRHFTRECGNYALFKLPRTVSRNHQLVDSPETSKNCDFINNSINVFNDSLPEHPFVACLIDSIPVNALLDTGSMKSFISDKVHNIFYIDCGR